MAELRALANREAESAVSQQGSRNQWAGSIYSYGSSYQGEDNALGNFDQGIMGVLNPILGNTVLDNSSAGLKISVDSLELEQSIVMGYRTVQAPEHGSDQEWFVTVKGGNTPVNLSFDLDTIGLATSEGNEGQYRLEKYNGNSWSLAAETNTVVDDKAIFDQIVLQDKGIYRVTSDLPIANPAPDKLANHISTRDQVSSPKAKVNIQLQGVDGQIFSAGNRANLGFDTIAQSERVNGASENADESITELEEVTVSTQHKLSIAQAEKVLKSLAKNSETRVQITEKIQKFLASKEAILGIKERDMLGALVEIVREQQEPQESVLLAEEQPLDLALEALEELQPPAVPVEVVAVKEQHTLIEQLAQFATAEEVAVKLDQADSETQEFSAQLQAATGLQQKSVLLINASTA